MLPCCIIFLLPRRSCRASNCRSVPSHPYSLAPVLQVKRVEAPTKSIGGILLPESTQSKLNEGVVLAVGPGKRDKDGTLLPMGVQVDDKVLLPQYGGSEIEIEDEEFVLFRDDDIMGVLKD